MAQPVAAVINVPPMTLLPNLFSPARAVERPWRNLPTSFVVDSIAWAAFWVAG